MQFASPVNAAWLASFTGASLVGDATVIASGINEVNRVEPGDIVFVDHPKYYAKCLQSVASVIIINSADVELPAGKALLVVKDPFEVYSSIILHFRPFEPITKSISDTAVIGADTVIGANAVIGNHVRIGARCIIHPNVTILDYCVLGDDVIIQSGTVIGGDAFYYNTKKDRPFWYKRMISCGRVVLADGVEIGASCTIDRGVSNDTIIGAGTKIDNQVHIGHDNIIGKNCLIAAQVGIAGATTLEDGVILWGQVGVNKTITIGQNAVVHGQAGVVSSLEGGKAYWGTPAIDVLEKKRESVWVKRIPEIWKRLQG